MTRINLIDPSVLSDKHLIAEYHELPRIFTLVEKASVAGRTPDDYHIPSQYVLGKGHVTFFYDKLNFLLERFLLINSEMERRNFDTRASFDRIMENLHEIALNLPDNWVDVQYVKYKPTHQEIYLNMARLVNKASKQCSLIAEELRNNELRD